MKILIDGFNLGLKKPTGIGIYSYNLAKCLNSLNHDVSVLYGINQGMKWWDNKEVNHIDFFQKLAIKGEEKSIGIGLKMALAFKLSFLLPNILLNKGIKPEKIDLLDFQLILEGLEKKLPPIRSVYNYPSIFRISQAYAAITGKQIPISKPKQLKDLDILHLTLPMPLKKVGKFKKVVTCHDLIPFKFPASTDCNVKDLWNIQKASLNDADQIFSISKKTKEDLVKIYKIKESKIHITYQMSYIPESIKKTPEDTIKSFLKEFRLKYKKYFIFYGAIEPKKNVLRILQAYRQSNSDHKLLIVGKNGWLYEKEEEFLSNLSGSLRTSIVRLPYASFVELMFLLKGAKALLFPSLYEGFGLPILEAMQLGIPVITSKFAPLTEVAGDAAFYVDPFSVADLQKAIEKFSNDDQSLNEYNLKGLKQAEKFNEENYMKRLQDGYDKVLK